MALPTINTYYVNEQKIGLYWKASPKSAIQKWNVYGCEYVSISFSGTNKGVMFPGNFTYLTTITNRDDPRTPGSVFLELVKADLSIDATDSPYNVTIRAVDANNVESPFEVNNVHAIPLQDSRFVDEAGWPVNQTYKNFEIDLWNTSGFDKDRYLNITSLMGRPAKQIKIDNLGTDPVWVKFNSFGSDPISVRQDQNYSFDLKRGELQIEKIYLHNPGGNATVRIFVAG